MTAHGRSARALALFVAVLLALLFVVRVQIGTATEFTLSTATALQAILEACGILTPTADSLDGAARTVVLGRITDAATTLFVGASLGLSGALLQGLFRNDLASPGLIGVTSGASLGAMVGILVAGGAGWGVSEQGGTMLQSAAEHAPLVVTSFAFVGALMTAVFVMALSSRGGRVSVPTLLLIGVAMNACLGGVLAAVQDVLLRVDWQLAQATFGWLFGSLMDRTPQQVGIVAIGTAVSLAVVPFVAHELDLLGSGEETAESLGVSTARTKALVLVGASLSAAAAVAVAGQIAFVGLVVPHVIRVLLGSRHGRVLPLAALGGAAFLLAAETANIAALGRGALRPGIVLSLLGGPFFLALLLRRRRDVATW